MELPFRLESGFEKTKILIQVSILVLMELPFRLWSCNVKLANLISFNPCFNGIAFST